MKRKGTVCPQIGRALSRPYAKLLRTWGCWVLSSYFDLERVFTLKQLFTGP